MSDSSSKESWPEFLSLAVHEFRTPASVVSGYLRMLQADKSSPLSDRQRKMIEEAEKSCARLVALIAEMSDVGKIDSGAIKMAQAPVDVFSIIEDLAKTVHEAPERDVRLAARGDASGASLTGDAGRLRQAFSTIFQAIVREQPTSGTVVIDRRLDTRAGRSSAIIVVAAEDAVQMAYEAERALFNEKRGGLGLALPLARRVIELHGGRLSAPAGMLERGAAIVSFPLGADV